MEEIALIEFINARPVGNVLRDIAERRLRDLQANEIRSVLAQPELIPIQFKVPSYKVIRLLPSIGYTKLRRCYTQRYAKTI